jgi:hypothetical protein
MIMAKAARVETRKPAHLCGTCHRGISRTAGQPGLGEQRVEFPVVFTQRRFHPDFHFAVIQH